MLYCEAGKLKTNITCQCRSLYTPKRVHVYMYCELGMAIRLVEVSNGLIELLCTGV